MRRGAGFGMWMAVALVIGPACGAQDEPGRGVARISVINGDVSVRRGDSGDWGGGSGERAAGGAGHHCGGNRFAG